MSKTTNKAALLLAVAAGCAACTFTTTPGKGVNAEWTGTYQQQQAARKDRDRDLALRVRAALDGDPVLKPLGLRIFVDRGEVTLCGSFPDATTRDHALAVTEQVNGVEGVDTDCGN
ncbi:MAG: BON domain-containing protein [Gammaproteobacteria bacterium]